jgi:quercetin dioxygenase-like cupin family protein
MSFAFRRIVTVLGEDGKSQVHEDVALPEIDVPVMPGAQFVKLWGGDTPPEAGDAAPEGIHDPFFPGTTGNRWSVAIFPPAGGDAPDPGDAERLAAETEEVFPGLAGAFEPDAPGFHTSDTVDYVMLIEGELYLKLDDGVELHLTPGASVVQNGTRHAWENRGDTRAIVVSTILGAPRVR